MSDNPQNAQPIHVGDIAITPLWDGTLVAKPETILRLDPADARKRIDDARRMTGVDPLILPVRAFLVRSGGRLALIDTGSGTTKGPSMGHLPASIAAAGLTPAAVDSVLLTHLHMDHIGGLIDAEGKPGFPNAELIMHRREAEFFLETPVDRLDSRSARNIEFTHRAIAAYGKRVRRVADGEGLVGITARLAPGHTPGHTIWKIESRGEAAVVLGDVVHLAAIQLPLPQTPMIYDVDPDQAGRTRIALLDEIAREGQIVAGAHLPAPGIGRIVREGSGFSFVPTRLEG